MRRIRLNRVKSGSRIKFALVDDEDYDWLNQWAWSAFRRIRKNGRVDWRALRKDTTRKPYRTVYMHREIARRHGFLTSREVDHQDRDGVNNQKENLRPASTSENCCNRTKIRGCSSRFKGVCRTSSAWRAYIKINGQRSYLGSFRDEVSAARAYNEAAEVLFGEFALLNEIEV